MNATTTRSLVIERELPHPPERIWRALTQDALIREWMMENDFKPVVGHQFQFRSTPVPGWNGIIDSEVLVLEPNRTLSYSWGSMGLKNTVTWTLTATRTGTMLRMEQAGFPADQDAAFKGATYGWQRFIGRLEQVVARAVEG